MTKVMTPQGIERETDDLFYYDPKPYSDDEDSVTSFFDGDKPEDILNPIIRKTYEEWLERNGLKAEGRVFEDIDECNEVMRQARAAMGKKP